jgi:DNA-directed RNA polymerase subunit L
LNELNEVKKASYEIVHPLKNIVKIYYILDNKYKGHITQPFIDVLKNLSNVYSKINTLT